MPYDIAPLIVRKNLQILWTLAPEGRDTYVHTRLTHRECNTLCHALGIRRIKGGPRKVLLRRIERMQRFKRLNAALITRCLGPEFLHEAS